MPKIRPGISLLICLCLGAFAGCSSEEYRYVPEDQRAPNALARPEVVYSEPADAPKGTVRVLSMGIVDIKKKSDSDSKKFPALHLRMSISNQSLSEWQLSSADQRVFLPNEGALSPALANSDSANIPSLVVSPGELRTLDLYFRLPDDKSSAGDLPEFQFTWRLQAGATPVQESTHFARIPVYSNNVVAVYEPDPYLGWGPVWWG